MRLGLVVDVEARGTGCPGTRYRLSRSQPMMELEVELYFLGLVVLQSTNQ